MPSLPCAAADTFAQLPGFFSTADSVLAMANNSYAPANAQLLNFNRLADFVLCMLLPLWCSPLHVSSIFQYPRSSRQRWGSSTEFYSRRHGQCSCCSPYHWTNCTLHAYPSCPRQQIATLNGNILSPPVNFSQINNSLWTAQASRDGAGVRVVYFATRAVVTPALRPLHIPTH